MANIHFYENTEKYKNTTIESRKIQPHFCCKGTTAGGSHRLTSIGVCVKGVLGFGKEVLELHADAREEMGGGADVLAC